MFKVNDNVYYAERFRSDGEIDTDLEEWLDENDYPILTVTEIQMDNGQPTGIFWAKNCPYALHEDDFEIESETMPEQARGDVEPERPATISDLIQLFMAAYGPMDGVTGSKVIPALQNILDNTTITIQGE